MVTIRKATYQEVIKAIEETNLLFDHNVEPNRCEQKGSNFFVTLKVKDSHGKGARIGFTGRAMVSACWHVYGTFFDKLFEQNKDIVVVAMGKKITSSKGNWEDTNVGSIANPQKYSDLCRCNE